ncbi:MAG: sugar phosphate isomerase/epimerase [Bryobacterales bacterium]|jgi:sugar phosphate isomerase/epimerase|nr:sugar phosphate isomerase/epimerase [Bryobacterales bacterium]
MRPDCLVSRRTFLAAATAACAAPAAFSAARRPIGLELYSVRNELQKDLQGTVTAVARMGYEVVEFYSPYYSWTPEYAREVRKLLDGLGIRCLSTHNGAASFAQANLAKTIELNSILGCRQVIMASAGKVVGLDGWKGVAETLNRAGEGMKSAGLRAGFHNHQMEFQPLEGSRPIDVLAAKTEKSVVLQLDVGTCVEVGVDPVDWIRKNPGRFGSIHLKDYAPGKGYEVNFGEGAAPWKQIFQAAEATGGVEFYLIEQETSPTPLESVRVCLENYRRLHG